MSCLHFEKHAFQLPEDLRELEGKMKRERGKKKMKKESHLEEKKLKDENIPMNTSYIKDNSNGKF